MSKKVPGKITGFAVRSFFCKPATVSFPAGEMQIENNYRGMLTYDPANCTGCKICMRYCPAGAISVVNEGTKEDKKMKATLTMAKCIFCCQCVDSCPQDCLSYTQNVDLARFEKEKLVVQL